MKYPMKYLVVSDQMALQVILGFFRTNRRMDSLDDNWGTMLGNPKKNAFESTLCHKISPFFTLW